jgi:hypothetical protein
MPRKVVHDVFIKIMLFFRTKFHYCQLRHFIIYSQILYFADFMSVGDERSQYVSSTLALLTALSENNISLNYYILKYSVLVLA